MALIIGDSMTFTELYQKYLGFIWNAFIYDADVFSKWWLYVFFFIPFIFYLMFFVMKWAFLTAPLWLPVAFVFGFISEIFPRKRDIVKTDKKEEL